MNNITLPLDIKSLEIITQCFDKKGNIVIRVKSKKDHATCHICGNPATKPNGKAPLRRIRHLPLFEQPVYLEIEPIRYRCEHCDDGTSTTEQYNWVERHATTTKGLDDYILRSVIITPALKYCNNFKQHKPLLLS